MSRSRSRSPTEQKGRGGGNNYPPRQPRVIEGDGPKLFVAGFTSSTNTDRIKQAFEKFGNVTDFFVLGKKEPPFAFVTFQSNEQAAKALQFLQGKNVQGIKLKLNYAKPKPGGDDQGQRGRGRGGGGMRGGDRPRGCFKCGGEGHMARACQGGQQNQNPYSSRPNNNRGNSRSPINQSKSRSPINRSRSGSRDNNCRNRSVSRSRSR